MDREVDTALEQQRAIAKTDNPPKEDENKLRLAQIGSIAVNNEKKTEEMGEKLDSLRSVKKNSRRQKRKPSEFRRSQSLIEMFAIL